ncbi:YtzH-like family protein [Bacillus fonticola]|uniref:YtzH-like family protein n=1 Tax=Bacillus fonticola TaxID=2728853 RepID=UPI0014753B58|nr:YtzH-like family protein [Bacillus fonticola]
MPLRYEDQLHVLQDLLTNHSTDCCGSISECEQIERLAKSLLTNGNVEQNITAALQEIYTYSQQGAQSGGGVNTHISSHQQQLQQWVNTIQYPLE